MQLKIKCFKSQRLLILFLLYLIVTVFAVSGCSAQGSKVHKKTVHVSFNVPITGPFGVYGSSVKDGALMALENMKTLYPNINLWC